MFAEQRRQQILQILDTHGSTTLTELTRLLGASESTVRGIHCPTGSTGDGQ